MDVPVNDEVVILVEATRAVAREVRIPRADWQQFEYDLARGQRTTDVLARIEAARAEVGGNAQVRVLDNGKSASQKTHSVRKVA